MQKDSWPQSAPFFSLGWVLVANGTRYNIGYDSFNQDGDMVASFEENGIAFQYPENWELSREDTDQGWTVMVQSPKTAFFLLAYDESMPDAENMADTALEALRVDYDELESEAVFGTLAGQPTVGHDVQFFSLDLTNTCWIRAFAGGTGTLLAMWQVNDLDLEEMGDVLLAIRMSLRVDD